MYTDTKSYKHWKHQEIHGIRPDHLHDEQLVTRSFGTGYKFFEIAGTWYKNKWKEETKNQQTNFQEKGPGFHNITWLHELLLARGLV